MNGGLNLQDPKIVHVAVGVIVQADQVLICWRDASLHQGNRYEFPGGKIEADETPVQALQRELLEEINIQVKTVVRGQQLYFSYPEKTVCLHIFKVTAFEGIPCGQQNQAIRWVNKNELRHYQFPDANAAILRMVMLPEQYVITQPQAHHQATAQWLDWHIQHVPQQAWLYIRHKHLDPLQYQQVIKLLAGQRPDLKLMAMYSQIKALGPLHLPLTLQSVLTGVHFSQADLMQSNAGLQLPSAWYRFAACHDGASIDKANALSMDALLLSPLHATDSHTGQAGLGWAAWQQLCQTSRLPVYALGGVAPGDLAQVQAAGGFGVAGIRAFYRPAAAV